MTKDTVNKKPPRNESGEGAVSPSIADSKIDEFLQMVDDRHGVCDSVGRSITSFAPDLKALLMKLVLEENNKP